MKIDSSKNNKISKENKVIDQNKFVNNNEQASVLNDTSKKDFSQILEKTKEFASFKSESKNIDSKENNSNNLDSEVNKKESNLASEKKVKEEKKGDKDSDEQSDFNQQKTAIGDITTKSLHNNQEVQFPSARTILHIADLERIVSTIRSQQIGTDKQIVINLKKSVFEGLQLKLTISKDKNVTAEFIAASEKVKTQLNAELEELTEIMKNRGIKLTNLQMSLESDSNENNQNDSRHSFAHVNSAKKSKTSDIDVVNQTLDSDTSYRT